MIVTENAEGELAVTYKSHTVKFNFLRQMQLDSLRSYLKRELMSDDPGCLSFIAKLWHVHRALNCSYWLSTFLN